MYFRRVILGCAAIALSIPAIAQDANIDGRVGKLEKEMRAVQRQVFPNGAGKFIEPDIQSPTTTSTTTSSTTATVDLTARVDALEAQLAALTGQVELQGNNMRGLEGRLKAIETQLEARTASPVETIVPTATPTAASAPATPKSKSGVVATKSASVAKPNPARVAAVAAIERPISGDVFEDGYNYGFRLWEAKFYPESQAILEEIVAKFPKHKRASYARNLLGRAWLDDKKPATAVKVFYENYKADPRGDRAPDSLLFLGSALTDLGKAAEACEAFGELTKSYPDAANGRLAKRLTSSKTRAKCK